MTQEEEQLLIKDLYARLPYGVRYKGDGGWGINPYQHTTSICTILTNEEPLVYLRPMSSMTEEEFIHYGATREWKYVDDDHYEYFNTLETFDWLNEHHFDFRGLIEKGLALEAPKDMYKTE